MKPDPWNLKVITEVPSPQNKKELQAFLGIINYLSKFSPSTADVCEVLRQMTSVKTEWTWNVTSQKLFDKAKSTIKEGECMKFYDETKPLHLETDASGVEVGAGLLHTRSGTNSCRDMASDQHTQTHCIFKHVSIRCRKEIKQHRKGSTRYITHLKKVHHYCFAREVSITTDHKALVLIF